MIERDEAQSVADAGHADIMLTHDSPDSPWCTPRVAEICATNPGGWSHRAVSYAAVGRKRLTVAFEGVRPDLLVHGHYHLAEEAVVTHEGHRGRIVSLDMDGSGRNFALLNTADLTIDWLEERPRLIT